MIEMSEFSFSHFATVLFFLLPTILVILIKEVHAGESEYNKRFHKRGGCEAAGVCCPRHVLRRLLQKREWLHRRLRFPFRALVPCAGQQSDLSTAESGDPPHGNCSQATLNRRLADRWTRTAPRRCREAQPALRALLCLAEGRVSDPLDNPTQPSPYPKIPSRHLPPTHTHLKIALHYYYDTTTLRTAVFNKRYLFFLDGRFC